MAFAEQWNEQSETAPAAGLRSTASAMHLTRLRERAHTSLVGRRRES